MKHFIHTALLIIFTTASPVFSHSVFAYDHGYKVFDAILKQIVVVNGHQSSVDYAQLKSDASKFDEFVAGLEAVGEDEFDTWSREQQMSFLINTYNAFTIKLILDNYPGITSIKDLGGLFINSPWDKDLFRLFSKKTTLNFIEHQLLRKLYKDPRVHFVLVCASISCPPLRNEAYVAANLEQQLDDATINFMRDPERNRFNAEENRIEISKIFKWYKKDFTATTGSINAYVAPLMTDDETQRKLYADSGTGIKFLDYDWALNDTK